MENFDEMFDKVKKAQKLYSEFNQEQVDKIFRAAALAANNARIPLAKMAVAETGMGVVEDKVIKNHFASEYIYNKYKDAITTGIIEKNTSFGTKKIAEPIGVIGGIIPTTNPTSTAIFKTLLALKTRNGIILSPHPRAKDCTVEAAKIILNAAIEAGAPENIIGWIEKPSLDLTNQLMQSVNLILATGGPNMVKSAYSSGRPAIGVGAGNTPAVIDETSHLKMAVNSILISKTFDNGVICASEQSVIVVKDLYDDVIKEFKQRGAYILTEAEKKKVAKTIIVDGHINAAIVGQPAVKIAALAKVKVPENTKILIGLVDKIGKTEPFSFEKLSPVLALYKADDYKKAIDKAVKLVEFGGMGHTSVYYTDQLTNQDRIDYFAAKMKTGRVLVNMPSSHGAIGDIYNFKLEPSLTLGCGSWGGNSVSENVGIKHLLNVKTVAERRENMLWFKTPAKVYFKPGSLPVAMEELRGQVKRAFIVTDKPLFDLGLTEKITDVLEEMEIDYKIFTDVTPDPTLACAKKGAEQMINFNPDAIIALGGGSPMDAAKIMWVLYEHPEVDFEDLAMRFMDINKRIYKFPQMGEKAKFIAVPTTSGTGSEVTPFAVITDEKTGTKYPLADYELLPDVAIVDADLVRNMPKSLIAFSGLDALVHAIEAYVSVFATEYTNGMALEAIRLIFKYLPDSYAGGDKNFKAREKIHNAATIAGMAFANAFLGICHSMAHKLGSFYHLPHGLSNALLINEVIDFNASENPSKQTAFPQYKYPQAKSRYAKIADHLGLQGKTDNEKVKKLKQAIKNLMKTLDVPMTIQEAGVNEKEFMKNLDEISEQAFDDQCTGANPRYPLISELKDIYIKAYK